MDAETFAIELGRLAPPQSELIAEGLSQEESLAFQRRYKCVRKDSYEKPLIDDPVIKLISEYDVSSVEIGMVRFGSTITTKMNRDSWSIGSGSRSSRV